MKAINCLILEDEPIAQDILENYIDRLPFLTLIAKASNAFQAYEILSTNNIDLIFCDIQMPQISGLEFLKSLTSRPHIIMTTAFHQHAYEGYELDVIDYLLKPISFERFLKAIQKVKEKMDIRDTLQKKDIVAKTTDNQVNNETDFIFVKEDSKLIKIFFSEIQYVEGMKDYVKIYIENSFIVTYLTMKKLEENLPVSTFMRIHKSYILNTEKIKGLMGNMLTLMNGTQLPIGMQYRESVLKKIGGNLIIR